MIIDLSCCAMGTAQFKAVILKCIKEIETDPRISDSFFSVSLQQNLDR